ncbi:MAG: hypothetical protein DMG03_21910 [Acidobacteria bacterium]|nr:MAG: hypothetical protein DMG03_21910 [Acidobacteriota bacterium]
MRIGSYTSIVDGDGPSSPVPAAACCCSQPASGGPTISVRERSSSSSRWRCSRRERIERVFQLPPRPDHVVEQLHVLDRARELPSQLVGAVEQIQLAARLHPYAFEHDRAQRPAASAKRYGDHRGGRIGIDRRDAGAHPPHRRRSGRRDVFGAHAHAARDVFGVG